MSKVIEKAIALQIYEHFSNNDIVDSFQSAYKAGHSCETVLLTLYNDITTTIGKGNGKILVLLDLSAAFDTIDHVILFDILVNYVGLGRKALDLTKSYVVLSVCKLIAFSVSLQRLYVEFRKDQF